MIFPNLNRTVAYYDPANFSVVLNEISTEEFDRIGKKGFKNLDERELEKLKTIHHEIRHYSDHISTLWGQRLLLKYSLALNARLEANEYDFANIIEYKRAEAEMFFNKYYREDYHEASFETIERRWKWSPSCGLRFDSDGILDETRPIPFIRFSTYDGIPLSRVPLSVASLLETNAKWEELRLHTEFLGHVPESDRPFHEKMFENSLLKNLLYNQELVLYNAAVHLTANVLGISDIPSAFMISSLLATLALNVPEQLIPSLKYDETYFADWGNRIPNMLQQKNYGMIFFILLVNYEKSFKEGQKMDFSLLFEESGLPQYDALFAMAIDESSEIASEIASMKNFGKTISSLCSIGCQGLQMNGLCNEKRPPFTTLVELRHGPKILFNNATDDFEDFEITSKDLASVMKMQPIDDLSFEEWDQIVRIINSKMDEFFQIRGV